MSKNKGDKKGYTLVEVIVVCVIIGIMTTLAMGGLMAYQKYANFKKNNEYAQTIFSAAQNSMTTAMNDGTMEELRAAIGEGTGHKLSNAMVENSKALDQYAAEEKDNTQLYTYTFQKGQSMDDYEDEQKESYYIIYNMIAPYVYDDSILDATYTVEFDASNGVVLGVCYHDKAEDFYYGIADIDGAIHGDREMNISDRSQNARRELELGYYGADSATASIPAGQTSVIEEVTLNNGETLNVEWSLTEEQKTQILDSKYQLDLLNTEGDSLVTIEINDLSSDNTRIKSYSTAGQPGGVEDLGQLKVDCSVIIHGASGDLPVETFTFPAYVTENNVIHFVLDAVDFTSETQRTSGTKDPYANTYSILRLNIPRNESIKVRVTPVGQNATGTAKESDNSENTLFESVTDHSKEDMNTSLEAKEFIYNIGNGRHLYNIRFVEDAIARATNSQEKNEIGQITYQQTADINWAGANGIVENGNVYVSHSRMVLADATKNAKTVDAQKAFPAIETLAKNNTYIGAKIHASDGKVIVDEAYKIQNLLLNQIQNPNPDTLNMVPLGLFGNNSGVIKNITVEGAKVSGNDYVGTICGVNTGTLTDNRVTNGAENTEYAQSTVTGRNYVGGIAGSDSSGFYNLAYDPQRPDTFIGITDSNRNYSGLTNGAQVTGQTFVGGIVGFIKGDITTAASNGSLRIDEDGNAPIQKCVNQGFITGTGRCIGGIAGYDLKNAMKDCVNEPVITDTKNVTDLVKDTQYDGLFVGGLIGFNDGAVVTDCSSGDPKTATYIVGGDYVGGFFGYHTDGDGLNGLKPTDSNNQKQAYMEQNTEDDRNCSINYVNVAGESYVGGVTGANGELRDGSGRAYDNYGFVGAITQPNQPEEVTKDAFTIYTDESSGNSGNIYWMSNWTNAGIITATKNYAGGITGYNAGRMTGNNSDMRSNRYYQANQEACIRLARTLGETGEYAGGIAGRNTQAIRDCSYHSGILTAEKYIGGIAGENTITNGATGGNGNNRKSYRGIQSSSLEGDLTAYGSYVGGIVGENRGYFASTCSTDNHEVRGTDYVGGYVGEQDNTATLSGLLNKAQVVATDGSAGGIAGNVTEKSTLSDCSNASTGSVTGNDYIGSIAGGNAGTITNISNGNLKGKIVSKRHGELYAGGVVGYNKETGKITNAAIGEKKEPYEGLDVTLKGGTYGGIVGYNEGTLDGDANNSVYVNLGNDKVSAHIGGIAGRNGKKGTIKKYDYTGVVTGYAGNRYGYGGIVGNNDGQLESCHILNGSSIQAIGKASEHVALGGIAGKNTGSITACSVAGQFNSNTPIVRCSSTGYVGGIVGYNYDNGKVTNCQAGTGTSDNAKVTIRTVRGHIGGVAGYNTGKAAVTNCETQGAVTASAFAVDDGTGGIVGYNNSSAAMSDNTNNMNVSRAAGNSVGVGGIIGRQETQSTSNWTIRNCNNNGNITGISAVGGIIGRSKFKGFVMSNCENYGVIRASYSIAGGLVGDCYSLDTRANVSISGCFNKGAIYGGTDGAGRSGGIIGIVNRSFNETNISIYNCVNLGKTQEANGGKNNAGIMGGTSSCRNLTVNIARCRNYGNGVETGGKMSGIYGSDTVNPKVTVVLTENFGVAYDTYRITSASVSKTSKDNMYFADRNQAEEAIKSYIVTGKDESTKEEGTPSALFDEDHATRYAFKTKDKTAELEFEFSGIVSLESIGINWYQSNRSYKYDLYYYDANGVKQPFDTGITGTGSTTYDSNHFTTTSRGILNSVEATGFSIKLTDIENTPASLWASIWEIQINGSVPPLDSVAMGQYGIGLKVNTRGLTAWQGYTASNIMANKFIAYLTYNPSGDKLGLGAARKIDLDTSMDDIVYLYSGPPTQRPGWDENGIDDDLIAYYRGSNQSKLDQPTNLTLSNFKNSAGQSTGNINNLSWTGDSRTYYYKIDVNLYDTVSSNNPSDTVSYEVSGRTDVNIPYEDSWMGKYITFTVTAMDGSEERYNSDPATTERQLVENFLMPPKTHLELAKNSKGQYVYKVVLDNPGDYGTNNPTIHAQIIYNSSVGTETQGTVTFKAQDGEGYTEFTGNTMSVVLTSAATGVEGHRDSNENSIQTLAQPVGLFYGENSKATASIASSPNPGFEGADDNLSFVFQLNRVSGVELIYRSEYLFKDDDLGIDVALASAETDLSNVNERVDLDFAHFKGEFDKIKSSPATVRSYPWSGQGNARYAADVASGLTLEAVKAYIINGQSLISNPGTEQAALLPGYVLQKMEDETYTLYYAPMLAETNVFAKQILTIQVDPSVSRAAVNGNQRQTPASLVLTGSTRNQVTIPESKAKPIISKEYENENGQYTFRWTDDIEKGPYKVILTGTALNGEEEEIYSTDSMEEETLTLDGRNWRYQNLKLTVTRLGEENLLGHTTIFGTAAEQIYKTYIAFDTMEAPKVTLKDDNRDELIYQVEFDAITDKKEQKDLENYMIYVADRKTGKVLFTQDTNKAKTNLDLEKFQGKDVNIYVVAHAKEDAKIFSDSIYQHETSLRVPTRLPQAAKEEITIDHSYHSEEALTEEEFCKTGLTLSVATNHKETGHYIIEGTFYKDKALTDKVTSFTEDMTGTLEDASYKLNNLKKSYAGYYLNIRVRAVAENQISSLWSDEVVLRLPRVEPAAPDAEMTTVDVDAIGRDSIAWSYDKYVKTYQMEITELKEEGKDTQNNYKTRISVNTEKENPFTVEQLVTDQDGKEEWRKIKKPTISKDPEEVTIYSYPIQYEKHIKDSADEDKALTAMIECVVKTVDKKTTYAFRVVLPDVTTKDGLRTLGKKANDPYRYTSEVTIAGHADDTTRYADTNKIKWSRVPEFNEDKTLVWNTKMEEVE